MKHHILCHNSYPFFLFYISSGIDPSFWQYGRWFLLLRKVVTIDITFSNSECAALLLIQTNGNSLIPLQSYD